MKLINPFDRLKKRNNVPLSLFPASKKTATTMPIGRAVPLYCIDMIQGNRLKLSVEQLTRMFEMNGPLMQNFEVTFGAYFVPYVSLDHFFDSAWFSQNISGRSNEYLKARDFFNPATPDTLRVRCKHITPLKERCVGNGSLWQHLGCPFVKRFTAFNVEYNDGSSMLSGTDLTSLFGFDAFNTSKIVVYPSVDANPLTVPNNFCKFAYNISSIIDDIVGFTDSFTYHVFGSGDTAQYTWQQMFGNLTLPALQAKYIDYLNLLILDEFADENSGWSDYMSQDYDFEYTSLTSFNLYRWLAYLRIYSDWFLNPVYTACEDFRDMIGCAYLNSSLGMDAAFDPENNAKLLDDPSLSFFADFLQKGECLPVLWKKDQFTSIVQEDAASDVAIGSTIGDNFYNRMYAKFKDLVARMGRDYRSNTAALYGHKVGDNSLQRSQVIGYKSFSVQVGEIAQTSSTTSESNLGQFAGYAMSRDKAGLFDWTAEENGMVMIIAYIRPTAVAMAGQCDKSIFKSDYLDYLIPEFGGVGYQEVDAQRFDFTQQARTAIGLEERYAEYMSIPNEISGDMLDVYSYLTVDKLFPQIYQYGSSSHKLFYRNLYMWDTPALHRIFQNNLYDPVAIVAFFNGTVTRQLPATIRTDF